MSFDGKAFAGEVTEIVKGYVAREVAPLLKRIEELEARPLPERGEKGEPGERGEKGETGIGVRDALIDRSGILVLTLSDGTRRDLGVVVGKDGLDGQNGADGLPGQPGKDGKDGFDLEDFDVRPGDDGRTVTLSFTGKGFTQEFDLKFPVVIDKGFYKAGNEYVPGDGVTWGGCYWVALQKTTDKPDTEGMWRKAVNKGRDGKDAK